MNITIVFNHSYQLKNLHIDADSQYSYISIGNNNSVLNTLNYLHGNSNFELTILPLLESFRAGGMFKSRVENYTLIKNIIKKNFDRVIFFGVQDYYSWKLAIQVQKKGIHPEIVPDNLEFFLRGDRGFTTHQLFTLKGFIKSFISGCLGKYLSKEIFYFSSRPIYSLAMLKSRINHELAFYNVEINHQTIDEQINVDKNTTRDENVFISQPYYSDYSIDIDDWISAMETCFLEIGLKKNNTSIILHPRDTEHLKKKLLKFGFKFSDKLDSSIKVYGIFSTYLYQLAINKFEVYSVASIFISLLPTFYTDFIAQCANKLNLSCDGSQQWVIEKNAFKDLCEEII